MGANGLGTVRPNGFRIYKGVRYPQNEIVYLCKVCLAREEASGQRLLSVYLSESKTCQTCGPRQETSGPASNPLSDAALSDLLLDGLRQGCPPASAGEVTRTLTELGVRVPRCRVKRALESLVRVGKISAVEQHFSRNGRCVKGWAYGTPGVVLDRLVSGWR